MYGQEKSGLRGRNVEDIAGMTEEGRISHSRTSSYTKDLASKVQGLEKRRSGTPLGSPRLGAKVDKLQDEVYTEGLTSKRDRQAFALLVVLCMSFSIVMSEGASTMLICRSVR
jgi:hypothetical protein